MRIANNAFVNTGVFDDDIVLRLRDTADSCFHIINSDDGFGGSPGFIELNQGNASTLQITQPSTASLSVANNGATISTSGLISFNGTCTNPPLPANQ